MAEARQVVITGIGAVSAAGVGADKLWAAARNGISNGCGIYETKPIIVADKA